MTILPYQPLIYLIECMKGFKCLNNRQVETLLICKDMRKENQSMFCFGLSNMLEQLT